MSRPADTTVKLSETLSISEYNSGGHKGFWLYDKTRGMNLAMRAETEREAYTMALHYYQKRLATVEQNYTQLKEKVDVFVGQFADTTDE